MIYNHDTLRFEKGKREVNRKELSHEEFDDMLSKLYGYNSVNEMNKYNHRKDIECLSRYGVNCKRNK